jgi:RNA polymerase sigma-70 factor (ECF subfamily)
MCEDAYNKYCETKRRKIIDYAMTELNLSRDDAEDIAQETLIKAAKHIELLPDPERILTWLRRIARNTYIDGLRIRQRRLRLEEVRQADIEKCFDYLARSTPVTANLEDHISLEDIRAWLSEEQYKVLYLNLVVGRTLQEIAAKLNIAIGTVKSRKWRGVKIIREKLRDAGIAYYKQIK